MIFLAFSRSPHHLQTLASPTGQWPEAFHPLTGGDCMGDGHHVSASAKWAPMVRNCFVRGDQGTVRLKPLKAQP